MLNVHRRRLSRAFTLVELLVVISIIGVLIALLLPAVQSARESARAADCKNRLKQLSLAALMHHDQLGYFPGTRYVYHPDDAATTKCATATPTWLVRVMPYLEESAAYEDWDLSVAWHAHSEQARTHAPQVFLCPSRRDSSGAIGSIQVVRSKNETTSVRAFAPCGCPYTKSVDEEKMQLVEVRGALSDYAGNHGDVSPGLVGKPTDFYYGGNGTGVIIGVRPVCTEGAATGPRDRVRMASVTDGTSSTFLFGEKYVPADGMAKEPFDTPAYDGENLSASARLAGPGLRLASGPVDVLASEFSFGSWHPGSVHFAMVDGSVRSVATDTDTQVLGSLANRLDARVVELEN